MKCSQSLSPSGSGARFSIPLPSILVVGAAAFGLTGCAQQPPAMHGAEYFPQSIYGQASPRVVAAGETIPHGGGVYKTGGTYTVAGRTYHPIDGKRYAAVGLASWYGDAFHGRRTANGEIYDRNSISAAHPTMPLPSYARVTNLRNHYSIIVRVNDRGPFAPGRIMDVSRRVAELLDFRRSGTTRVKVDFVGPASLAGSDDTKLAATLRQDGQLARLDMQHPPTYVAESEPVQTAAIDPAHDANPANPNAGPAGQVVAGDVTADSEPEAMASTVVFKGKLPLPPARPFDLDTIPGADAEISAR